MATDRPVLLAIDTATAVTGLALFDGSLRGELTWRSDRNQTTELLPAMSWLARALGLRHEDIAAVAVSLGPGSFNGLRVGITVAKALAFARDLPCLGIGTLAATAHQFATSERAIRPLYDAGRGEVATALFRAEAGTLREYEPPRLSTITALAAQTTEPTLVCGEVKTEWIGELLQRAAGMVSFPTEAGMARRASFLAELGWRRWQAGERDDPISLQPTYLRRPAITPPRGT